MKAESEIKEVVAKAKINLDKPLAVTCGSGVSA